MFLELWWNGGSTVERFLELRYEGTSICEYIYIYMFPRMEMKGGESVLWTHFSQQKPLALFRVQSVWGIMV